MLPFPYLRALILVIAFLRQKDFADRYNMITQLFRHCKLYSLQSSSSARSQHVYNSVFDWLGDPFLMEWMYRLNFFVELLEALMPESKYLFISLVLLLSQ